MSGKLLNDDAASHLREVFPSELQFPVEKKYFSKGENFETWVDIALLNEITNIADLIRVRTDNLDKNPQLA